MTTVEADRISVYSDLLRQLVELRSEMLSLEASLPIASGAIHPDNVESAKNLAHYIALRRRDMRSLQDELASVGLSSLGRSEEHVLATVDAVTDILTELTKGPGHPVATPSLGYAAGRRLLKGNADDLLGPSPKQRKVRIMVTMPTEAASDYQLVEDLVLAGMNLMRINCAHDDPLLWAGMIENLRRAEATTNRECLLIMDIPGPKVRTGPIEQGPRIQKVRPHRSQTGDVLSPAIVCLTLNPDATPIPGVDATVPLEPSTSLQLPLLAGDRLTFIDARYSRRSLTVVSADDAKIVTELRKTAYLATGGQLILRRGSEEPIAAGTIGELPPIPAPLLLRKGDHLLLTVAPTMGREAVRDSSGEVTTPAQVSCTAPEAVSSIKVGQPIWFDDGKFGGIARKVDEKGVLVEITVTPPGVVALGPDKGINLPETDIKLPAISQDDDDALKFIAKNADLVGQSFVRTPADVAALRSRLEELGGGDVGIVLKIETRQGFNNLPSLLFEAMKSRRSGVMIARGDLAVECGWERLAEIQEEILWFCEAAHAPVVWATQVLENLTKTGMPSRAEITDAAYSESAECVMLNKGPHMVEATRTLDDILGRMQSHQDKKSAMMRRLHIAENFKGA